MGDVDNNVRLISALRSMLVSLKTAQTELHQLINTNVELTPQLNELWNALDKAELHIRRIIQ